jgi:uroporphyrinogen III methyltransferase/synthase
VRPLLGKRILVTRTREQASKLASLLADRGAVPVLLPTIRTGPPSDWGPLDLAIANLRRYDWAIFTSINGVQFVLDRLACHQLDGRALAQLRLGAIGPATAAALTHLGLTVACVPSAYVAEAIVDEMRQFDLVGQRILLPRAQEARAILGEGLRRQGALVDDVAAYQTRPDGDAEAARQLFRDGEIDVVTLTSSSTVRNLIGLLADRSSSFLGGVVVASIGPITSQTIREFGIAVDVEATEHTMPGLVSALERHHWE